MIEFESAAGSSTKKNGGGAPTASSSVPSQRHHWISPPEPKSAAAQIPIIPPRAGAAPRPDPHPPGAGRLVQERPLLSARLEHVEGDRPEDQRLEEHEH